MNSYSGIMGLRQSDQFVEKPWEADCGSFQFVGFAHLRGTQILKPGHFRENEWKIALCKFVNTQVWIGWQPCQWLWWYATPVSSMNCVWLHTNWSQTDRCQLLVAESVANVRAWSFWKKRCVHMSTIWLVYIRECPHMFPTGRDRKRCSRGSTSRGAAKFNLEMRYLWKCSGETGITNAIKGHLKYSSVLAPPFKWKGPQCGITCLTALKHQHTDSPKGAWRGSSGAGGH